MGVKIKYIRARYNEYNYNLVLTKISDQNLSASKSVSSGLPPPPPPFPSSSSLKTNAAGHLKPKKKFCVDVQMKKANWVEISPRKITENTFWAKCQEEKLASKDIFAGLTAKFAMKKTDSSSAIRTNFTKKCIDSRVINLKSALGISILLGASLKHVSYEDLKKYILRCDTSILNSDIIQQLLKYFPLPTQLEQLQRIKNSGGELSKPEEFIAIIGEIDQIVPRLQSINLILCFDEIAREIERDTHVGMATCEAIRESKKLSKILEIVLLCGNFLNSGSTRGPAFGFELSFLTKLENTKDLNKQTLLHFIVNTIENEHPELLSFGDDLPQVEIAARVSFAKIHDNMEMLIDSVKQLNWALTNLKEPQTSDDKFRDVMSNIAIQYNHDVKELTEATARLESQYKDIGEYFVFDPENYPMENFFSDIKNFKTMFAQAYKDNLKIREEEKKDHVKFTA